MTRAEVFSHGTNVQRVQLFVSLLDPSLKSNLEVEDCCTMQEVLKIASRQEKKTCLKVGKVMPPSIVAGMDRVDGL